ncbi:hypothetical protein EON62_01985 [archaeon]|nr:MAG: hypothetical protein EON62_01985 [archaeon]
MFCRAGGIRVCTSLATCMVYGCALVQVMERRNKLAEEQARRVAEIAERDASAKREQEEGEMLRATYGKRLKEWAEESNGTKKNIRILLSTLQDVLWSDAKWEPVSMAKLIDPRRAKISFMKACTIVHPDKQNTMDNTQRYIAKEVFFYLETAFRHLQETEL